MIEIKAETSVVINVPPEDAFAYVSDIENMVDWSGVVIAIRKTSPGPMQAGSTLWSTMRFLGRWLETTYEVIEWNPGRYLTLKSTAGLAPCIFYYRFEPIEGGSRVTQEASIYIQSKAWFLGLAETVVAGAIRRQAECDLLTLKDVLETRAMASAPKQREHSPTA